MIPSCGGASALAVQARRVVDVDVDVDRAAAEADWLGLFLGIVMMTPLLRESRSSRYRSFSSSG
jgi:hypothetical protein